MKHLIILSAVLLSAYSVPAVYAAESADSTAMNGRLHEVVVTGTNAAVVSERMPYSVSAVGQGRIEGAGSPQLLSALSGMVPSLFVSQRNVYGFGISNGGSGGIKIRGVGGSPTNAVLMLIDGQPQFAGVFSHHVADFYQTDYVERVEVLRGPASVLYGSNAMGGVINVITREATRRGGSVTLSSEYGSFNTWQNALTAEGRAGRMSGLLSLAYDRTDGVKKNFDFRQANGYASVAYEFSRHWKLRATYSLMRFRGNDPVYPRLSDPESTDIYRQTIVRGEGSMVLTDSYGPVGGSLRVYYSYGNHFVADPRRFHSLDDRIGAIANQSFPLWTGASATAGFDFDVYSGRVPVSGGKEHAPGSMATMDRKHITEYSPYLSLSQLLWSDRIMLNAGLRVACSSLFRTRVVPQGGVTYVPARGWSVKASVAAGYRNPSFRELYLYRQANPDLEPENMINYEVSVGRQFGRWLEVELTGYMSRGRDMIQTVDQHNVNTGHFINKGIEVAAKSHPIDRLHLWATYSYLHTSLDDLTGAPQHQYYLGLGWDLLKQLHVDAGLKGVGLLFVAQDYQLQSYATLNLRAAYTPCRFVQLWADLDNVTDARYTINRGYPMPGFTVSAGLKLTIK